MFPWRPQPSRPVPMAEHLRRRRAWIAAAGIVPLVVLLSLADRRGWFFYPGSDQSRYQGRHATVIDAIDGNTLEIDVPDISQPITRVRLLGTIIVGNGREALILLRQLARGRTVRLSLPPPNFPGPGAGAGADRDAQGNLLAFVEVPDGSLLNKTLLTAGVVKADTRQDHPRFDEFARLERDARHNHVGLWAGRSNLAYTAFPADSPGTPGTPGNTTHPDSPATMPSPRLRESHKDLKF